MNSLAAFAMGEANRHKELMVFDWEKAARLILERNATEARAGLCGDWEYTGGLIYQDGKPVSADKAETYLASTWAEPEIEIDGDVVECWKMQHETPGWDSGTFWPEEAMKIIQNEK